MRTEKEIKKLLRDLYIKSVALKKKVHEKDGDMRENVSALYRVEASIGLLRWVLGQGGEGSLNESKT